MIFVRLEAAQRQLYDQWAPTGATTNLVALLDPPAVEGALDAVGERLQAGVPAGVNN